MRAAVILASFALLACGDSLAPVTIGTEYQLRRNWPPNTQSPPGAARG